MSSDLWAGFWLVFLDFFVLLLAWARLDGWDNWVFESEFRPSFSILEAPFEPFRSYTDCGVTECCHLFLDHCFCELAGSNHSWNGLCKLRLRFVSVGVASKGREGCGG